MVNTDKLLGIMAEKHKSQNDVAKALNMSRKTFYLRMQKKVFGSDEIEGMIKYLDISDPMPIFFADEVTS
jgi:hypothetical protein